MQSTAKVATPVVHNAFVIPKGLVPKETLELSPEQRVALRVLLADPVFKRAIEFAQLQRPSSFFSGPATTEEKVERLAEIRGWDACLMAICLQAQTEVYNFKNYKSVGYNWTQPSGYENNEEG